MSRIPNFQDLLDPYALQFEDGVIYVNGTTFTAINNIKLDQSLTEAAVFGTTCAPIKRTRGRLELGQGSITFSDFDSACDFYHLLEPDPLFQRFDLDYTLVRNDGIPRNIEVFSCRVTKISLDHASGGKAAEMVVPFSFMSMKVDRIGNALSPLAVLQGALGVGSQLSKLLL